MDQISTITEVMKLIELGCDLTNYQAALAVNRSPRTLETLRRKGGGPEYIKYKRTVRYPAASIIAWKNARIRNTTSE